MPRFLPGRSRRGGKSRIGESPQCYADLVGPEIGLPVDGGAAFWAKMKPELPAFLAVPGVDLASSFGSNLGLLEIHADAIRRARAALTFAAMTCGDDSRFASGFHPQ